MPAPEEVIIMLRRLALTLCALLFLCAGADAGKEKLSLVDKDGASQGSAAVHFEKGSAKAKFTLAPLPAAIDTGTEQFEATIYKAYLVNSLDPAVEISLGNVYPTTKSKAKLKAAFKGDLSGLGLDKLVVVAFSKDGLSSFDVLSAMLETP
jgi:hypothetical protein